MWITGPHLWAKRQFRWNQENVRGSPCAGCDPGHRTSPTHSGNGERDNSETRVQTVVHQLAGGAPRRLGDEAAGTGADERVDRKRHRYRSTRRALATHTRKGPSPISGAFAIFLNPAQLWGSEHFLWTTNTHSVDESAISGGTTRMFAKALAPGVIRGIELLPRPPAREGGTARRRGSGRSGTGLPGKPRGGEVTTPAGTGVEERSTGSVAVPVNPKGPWNSYFQGPFTYVGTRPGRRATPLAPRPRVG